MFWKKNLGLHFQRSLQPDEFLFYQFTYYLSIYYLLTRYLSTKYQILINYVSFYQLSILPIDNYLCSIPIIRGMVLMLESKFFQNYTLVCKHLQTYEMKIISYAAIKTQVSIIRSHNNNFFQSATLSFQQIIKIANFQTLPVEKIYTMYSKK